MISNGRSRIPVFCIIAFIASNILGVHSWPFAPQNQEEITDPDYYGVLELNAGEDSSVKDIKRQFRLLSKKYHPDHNTTDEARDRYTKIQRAHEILSNRKKRKVYDMKGEAGIKMFETQEKAGGTPGHDLLTKLFGGNVDATHGPHLQLAAMVNLTDIYNGANHEVVIRKQKVCKECKGTGAETPDDLKACVTCQGQGIVLQRVSLGPGMVQQVQSQCPSCHGMGKSIVRKCPRCKGKKTYKTNFTLEFEIEKGIPDGYKIVFDLEADESPDTLPGDIILRIINAEHPVFTRHKSKPEDLVAMQTLSLFESLTGFQRILPHLDGHEIHIFRDASKITAHNETITMKGEGLPLQNVPSEMGDLQVRFNVQWPQTSFSAEQKETLRRLLK